LPTRPDRGEITGRVKLASVLFVVFLTLEIGLSRISTEAALVSVVSPSQSVDAVYLGGVIFIAF
jgi:hypothetical protein